MIKIILLLCTVILIGVGYIVSELIVRSLKRRKRRKEFKYYIEQHKNNYKYTNKKTHV